MFANKFENSNRVQKLLFIPLKNISLGLSVALFFNLKFAPGSPYNPIQRLTT